MVTVKVLRSCYIVRFVDTSLDKFQKLTANGVQGAIYENIRPAPEYHGYYPVEDLASIELRCGFNTAPDAGVNTSTVSVPAGSPLTFTADIQAFHSGALSLYVRYISD